MESKDQERIKEDAERYTKDEGYQKAYIAGAIAEAPWKVKYEELVAENERLKRWKAEALTLLSLVDAYADKHPEIKLGQGKVEFTISRAKERDALKERCEKMELGFKYAQIRVISLLAANDKQVEFIFEKVTEALKEGESNTPAPVLGEKEVDNGEK